MRKMDREIARLTWRVQALLAEHLVDGRPVAAVVVKPPGEGVGLLRTVGRRVAHHEPRAVPRHAAYPACDAGPELAVHAFIVSMAVLPEPMTKMGLSLSLLNCMSALQAGVSTCTVVMYMRWC